MDWRGFVRILLAPVAVLAAGVAWAASGDALVVLKDRVNLRAEPSTSGAVVDVLALDQRLVELAREGEWVQVRLVGGGGAEGWVHASLIGSDQGAIEAEAVAEPAAPDANADLATFEAAVEQLDAGAKAQGYEFYGPVTDLGGGAVQVVVTERWLATPETFRKGNLETLFAVWSGLGGGPTPVVRLVDGSGAVVMERFAEPAVTSP
jgi:SH3-like domain-containing protein